jgi:uroporphyrinogen-III decarboxylase
MSKMMTSKERVTAAVEFKGPDRVPYRHAYLPAAFIKYPKLVNLLKQYPSDIAGEGNVNLNSRLYSKGSWYDEWNCLWTVIADGFLGQVTGHPLEDLNMLKHYSFPRPEALDFSGENYLSYNEPDKYKIFGWLTLFERIVDLRGFENTMIDICTGDAAFLEIRDRIVEFNLKMIDRYLELNPDCISFADDWGSQSALMIDPACWRELFLPSYIKMFSRVRESGKHVYFHTDGVTLEILPDLVDAGVNIFWSDLTLNPLTELKDRLGGKVCFQGLTDVQFVMNKGSVEDVVQHGKNLLKNLADFNGGFIACTEFAPDQPFENMKAMYETFFNYGSYPLKFN